MIGIRYIKTHAVLIHIFYILQYPVIFHRHQFLMYFGYNTFHIHIGEVYIWDDLSEYLRLTESR